MRPPRATRPGRRRTDGGRPDHSGGLLKSDRHTLATGTQKARSKRGGARIRRRDDDNAANSWPNGLVAAVDSPRQITRTCWGSQPSIRIRTRKYMANKLRRMLGIRESTRSRSTPSASTFGAGSPRRLRSHWGQRTTVVNSCSTAIQGVSEIYRTLERCAVQYIKTPTISPNRGVCRCDCKLRNICVLLDASTYMTIAKVFHHI